MGRLFRGIVVVTFWSAVLILGCKARCDRSPEKPSAPRTPDEGRFKIVISGNPDKYVPGEQYNVILSGTISHQIQHKFKEFMLAAEADVDYDGAKPVGSFTLYNDLTTEFGKKCPNSVRQINSLPKTEIKVKWLAPPSGSGCIAIRAMVMEQRDLWYMDDGQLTKMLCEDLTESMDNQPEVLRHCCACDEAKYEVTFEGLWSRNTHPKDFPSNGWLTRFSDVIGASHTVDYAFWNNGELASEGLQQVAEKGNTKQLETELKSNSEHIRTIIKARGVSYPNVTGKTFAVFRVDNKHHLMSLVSMIDPSPDWIVGVSGFELCQRNCTWVESKILNLYPYDVGTDDGITYISPDQPSNPHRPVKRIRSNSPNDPRSPFYDVSGEDMKPLARLYLSRQRLYEKVCDPPPFDFSDSDQDGECAVTDWSEWSPCSATCGKGLQYKQRRYKNEGDRNFCNVQLTARKACSSHRRCPDFNSSPKLLQRNPECKLTDWGEWSKCSVTCGVGVRTRSRRYMNRSLAKKCAAGFEDAPIMEQNEKCKGAFGPCRGELLDNKLDVKDCSHRPWSLWSPCSVTCGIGIQVRTRDPIFDSTEMESERDLSDPCLDPNTSEMVECFADVAVCPDGENAATICSLPKDPGLCEGSMDRWFFDGMLESCNSFTFTGCPGNRNLFLTRQQCESFCEAFKLELQQNRTAQQKQLGVSVSGVLTYNLQYQNDGLLPDNSAYSDLIGSRDQINDKIIQQGPIGKVVDCETSRWSPWSSCIPEKRCGKGIRSKSRTITTHPINGGKPCPKRLKKIKACEVECGPSWGPGRVDCKVSDWSSWSPCSRTCGPHAVRQRTRSILVHPSGGGMPCPQRMEEKPCHTLSCPLE